MNNQNNRPNDRNRREPRTYVDYEIFRGDIRLVTSDGRQVVMNRDDAIAEAKTQGMNLVQVSYSKAVFPHSICKIMDYGKFRFDQKKREKENLKKARQANAEIKEICFSIRIDDGDKNTKIRHIRKFLSDNDKVKIVIKLSRREMRVKHLANDLMNSILKELSGECTLDRPPTMSENIMSCVIRQGRNDTKGNNTIKISVK